MSFLIINDDEIDNVFINACRKGYLITSKWLIENRQYFPIINVHAENEFAFRSSCQNGHHDTAKWLVTNFPDINIHAENEFAFKTSCQNGYHDIYFNIILLQVICKFYFCDIIKIKLVDGK